MDNFELHILGCGSATPTTIHNPSSQVLSYREKLFMVDCGEGTQLQMRHNKLRLSKLNHIFISHLHGDHCFGLIGLISTLGLLGRTGDIVIHSIPDLEMILRPQLDYFCRESPFKVIFAPFNSAQSELIYEDRSMAVKTIPLKHRVPCAGFLFEEKPKQANLIGSMIDFHNVPIRERSRIKEGADFVKEDGTIIPNSMLVVPPKPSRSYAYCSDTAYNENIIPLIEGVDLLYHEATFAQDAEVRAKQTGHSTSIEAATIAQKANVKKLVLGHFSARYSNNEILLKEAKSIFENTVLAYEGMCENI